MSAPTSSSASPTGLPPTSPGSTDFAQVEDDETQINLSRFSLFFPEKREFFLEGAGGLRLRRPANPRPRLRRRLQRCSHPVLQPVDRHLGRQRGADCRGRPAPRPRRRLPDGPHEHPGRRRARPRRGVHELQRRPGEAGHLLALQHRGHRHPSEPERRRHRLELALRRGRSLQPDRSHPDQHLLHGNQRARKSRPGTRRPATWASSATTPT